MSDSESGPMSKPKPRLSEQEEAYNAFVSTLYGGISWKFFAKFSRYPGFVRKAVKLMLEKQVLSRFRGYEVYDPHWDFSWNLFYGGKTYFTNPGDVRSYIAAIGKSPVGKELELLTPEKQRLATFKFDSHEFYTTLPLKIRRAG